MDEKTLEYMQERVKEGRKLQEAIKGLKSFRKELESNPKLRVSTPDKQLHHIITGVLIKDRFGKVVTDTLDELIAEFEEEFQKL